MLLFSVKDKKAETFSKVISDVTRGTAARNFGDYVMQKDSAYGTHPEDFALYLVGEFNEVTGLLSICAPPDLVCSASDYISK